MKKSIKKIIYLCLTMLLIVSIFAGCKSGKEGNTPIVPETQILNDKYGRNKEITDIMTYTVDYITNPKYQDDRGLEVVYMYDYIKIQVDGWSCMTVGRTSLKEIVAIIDKANADYKATQGEDADNLYQYNIKLGKKSEPDEYKPTLLIDSSRHKDVILEVSKYGIPYVTLHCYVVRNIYNNGIIQESDWIMNSICAADVSAYIDKKTGAAPEFVDQDGLNKAAKQNMFMDGNISFGGNGFTWESLMTFCNALELEENNGRSNKGSFRQSSDKSFTYYTIILHTNPFLVEGDTTAVLEYAPSVRLVATFDPLTQVCINWTIDTITESKQYIPEKTHEFGEIISVNVHEYKVDTNDYEGMRESIKSWIEDNSIKTTTKYCVLNYLTYKVEGTIDSGATNLFESPTINGVKYSCIKTFKDVYDNQLAVYISEEDLNKAAQLTDRAAYEAYIEEHKITWAVACCVFENNDNLIGYFVDTSISLVNSTDVYYVTNYDLTDNGYANVKVLKKDMVPQLLMMYIKTYRLDEDQGNEIQNIADTKGLMAVSEYINKLFAEAEKAQKENNNK